MDKTSLDWRSFKTRDSVAAAVAENSRKSEDYLAKLEFSRMVSAKRAEAARLARVEERNQREKLLMMASPNNINNYNRRMAD